MISNKNGLTDIPGIQVGHATNLEGLTGCTVVLCPEGAVAGVDQRGGAPGTREIDVLRPLHLVQMVHAVVLAGGSAFGLDAASGVVRFLEERGVGFDAGVARVPIVSAAVLFDLAFGRPDIRPDADMGYVACQMASTGPVPEGNVGAGTGATIGKILGMAQAMKAGIGSASIHLRSDLVVAALVAVNALGDIVDPANGQIIAGARKPGQTDNANNHNFADSLEIMKAMSLTSSADFSKISNTVIGIVATNAMLTKEEATKVAQMAHDGLARAIRPAHTMYDGDTIFALSLGKEQADLSTIGAFAAEAFSQAILRAARTAQSLGGLPSVANL